MKNHVPQEESARILAMAIVAWGVVVALGAIEGVFSKLSETTRVALALFALVYAPATYWADRTLREFVLAIELRSIAIAALAMDVALGAAMVARVPLPFVAFFGAPLAVAMHVALLERFLRHAEYQRRLSSAAGKSPGGRPAAT
jgi:hypothetical protein